MNSSLVLGTAVLLAISVAMLLALFLLFLKSKKKLSNTLFAIFLILTAVDISGMYHFPSLGIWPMLDLVRSMLILLHLPVFYAYIKSVCYSDFGLSKKDWLGVFPFLVVIALLLLSFFLLDLDGDDVVFTQAQLFLFINVLLHLQIAFYLFLSFRVLQRFKHIYVNNFAGNQLEAYNWLFRLTVALTLFYILALVKNVFKFTDSAEVSELLKVALLFFELVILCWYLFQAISKPEIFKGIHSKLSLETSNDTNVAHAKIADLRVLMTEEKPFLDPSISVKDVAERIEMPARELSELLNKQIGKHFFDFINEYRIKEAQKLLGDSSKKDFTILEILYEVGFNSKSSFNTAFKKHTGKTPTEYRKSLI